MEKVRVVKICDGEPNHPEYLENDILKMSRLVKIDRSGNPYNGDEPFEIVEIKDNINIISSPAGEKLGLPILREIGKSTKIYGVAYVVKMRGLDMISLTMDEAIEYCVKLTEKKVSVEYIYREWNF